MIIGAHSIIYSVSAERDRAFLRDVLGLASVDAGDGWLVFALPPAEVAVHPSEENDVHEFYLITDDLVQLVAHLQAREVECSPVETMSWGTITYIRLPGGGRLGVYEPQHARPRRAAAPTRKPAKRSRQAARPPAARRKRRTAPGGKVKRRR